MRFMYESDAGKTPMTLEKVLDLMGNNFKREATYLIPDLQREYVWSSKKIINLIDTLMKGWPFGQILVANTGKLSPMFAPRTFFSKVGEDNRGKYVLLQDIWHADSIEGLENECHIDDSVKPAFRAFCERFRGLKNVHVPQLRVLSREKCGLDEDEYNEMILSIFTRLNAGGKPLTEEEITYSWIKRYWPRKDVKAEDALNELRRSLAVEGIPLKSHALIRVLSRVWSAFERGGKTLSTADMLDGELLKSASTFIGDNWEVIASQFENIASMLKKHDLRYGAQFYSLQGYELLVTWSIIGKIWQERHGYACKAAENLKLNPLFGEWVEDRLDRFVFACQWAGSHDDCFAELSKLQEEMANVDSFDGAKTKMVEWFESHLLSYVNQAKRTINELNKTSRAGVR